MAHSKAEQRLQDLTDYLASQDTQSTLLKDQHFYKHPKTQAAPSLIISNQLSNAPLPLLAATCCRLSGQLTQYPIKSFRISSKNSNSPNPIYPATSDETTSNQLPLSLSQFSTSSPTGNQRCQHQQQDNKTNHKYSLSLSNYTEDLSHKDTLQIDSLGRNLNKTIIPNNTDSYNSSTINITTKGYNNSLPSSSVLGYPAFQTLDISHVKNDPIEKSLRHSAQSRTQNPPLPHSMVLNLQEVPLIPISKLVEKNTNKNHANMFRHYCRPSRIDRYDLSDSPKIQSLLQERRQFFSFSPSKRANHPLIQSQQQDQSTSNIKISSPKSQWKIMESPSMKKQRESINATSPTTLKKKDYHIKSRINESFSGNEEDIERYFVEKEQKKRTLDQEIATSSMYINYLIRKQKTRKSPRLGQINHINKGNDSSGHENSSNSSSQVDVSLQDHNRTRLEILQNQLDDQFKIEIQNDPKSKKQRNNSKESSIKTQNNADTKKINMSSPEGKCQNEFSPKQPLKTLNLRIIQGGGKGSKQLQQISKQSNDLQSLNRRTKRIHSVATDKLSESETQQLHVALDKMRDEREQFILKLQKAHQVYSQRIRNNDS